MTLELINGLWYVGFIIALSFVFYLAQKIKITKTERDNAKMILTVIKALVGNSNFKYKGDIEIIVNYTLEAMEFVDSMEQTQMKEDRIKLIKQKALEICHDNGLSLNADVVNAIDMIVDIVVHNIELPLK